MESKRRLKADDPALRFSNKKAQMYQRLADLLEREDNTIDNPTSHARSGSNTAPRPAAPAAAAIPDGKQQIIVESALHYRSNLLRMLHDLFVSGSVGETADRIALQIISRAGRP